MNESNPTDVAAKVRPVYTEVCPVCGGSRYAERFSESRGQIGSPSGRCPYCAGTGYVVYEAPQQ